MMRGMGLVERRVVLLMILMKLMEGVQMSHAEVYKVGDQAGWTTIGNVDYKKWASSKNFKVGDTIIFEYNPQFHNVMRVTHGMFKSCNASSNPLATFTTGNDSIKINDHGHHFFLCGVPGHCQLGQKVDINVVRVSADSTKPPTPSTLPSPVLQASDVPAPSPNMAFPSLVAFKVAFAFLGLPISFFALPHF